jgi:hypothetical protein
MVMGKTTPMVLQNPVLTTVNATHEHHIRHGYPVISVHIEEFSCSVPLLESVARSQKGYVSIGEENGLNVALANALSSSFSFARSRLPFSHSSSCHHVFSPVLAS